MPLMPSLKRIQVQLLIGGFTEQPDETIKTAMKNLGVQEKEIGESEVLEINLPLKNKGTKYMNEHSLKLRLEGFKMFARNGMKIMEMIDRLLPIGRIQKGDEIKLFIPFPDQRVSRLPSVEVKEEPKGKSKEEFKDKEKQSISSQSTYYY
eukprot:TRINITY_DN503_c0_g2_i1.p3 TRINITY_DN503_c0_g2~~TRINITY_DN503_c0_g2_i1.p3  ORF type:complete len:150 (-),score=9.38 TRINITY_DN503_c0_g2_i1:130-579(-)